MGSRTLLFAKDSPDRRRGTKLILRTTAALILTLGTWGCSRSKDNKVPPPLTSTGESCEVFKKALPKDVIQGYVEVPEDYEDPNGHKIKVFYYGRTGTVTNPTIVFFNGGPSGDSHSSYQSLESKKLEQGVTNSQFPLLYIDQRGTGCSTLYPKVQTIEDLIRLGHYGSREIVLDAETIRNKVQGKKTWKVFGQSFGGLIGKRYLQIAPKGIRSIHVHGFSNTQDDLGWLAQRIDTQNRLTEDFLAANPGTAEIYDRIENLITNETCIGTGPSKTCGRSILYSFARIIGFQHAWPFLNHTLRSFLKNDQLDLKAMKRYLELISDSEAGDGWGGLVVAWVDMGTPSFNFPTCSKIFARLEAEGKNPGSWRLHECKVAIQTGNADPESDQVIADYLSYVPQNILDLEVVVAAATSSPNIPFYLYSSGQDGFVPEETFAEEVARLGSRIYYENFPTSGHEGFATEEKIWVNLLNDLSHWQQAKGN